MDDFNRSVLIICIAAVFVTALVVGGVMFHTRQFINGGYCQGSIPGISGTVWLKCDAKPVAK